MSAEMENNKEEEAAAVKDFPKRQLYLKILDNWQIAFKILELILCATCVGFAYDPVNTTGLVKNHLHHVSVMYTAYTGYMLIIVVLLAGRFLGDRLGFKTATIFSAVGAAMFLTTGILLLSDKTEQSKDYYFHPQRYLLTMLVTSLIFAFVNAFVFAIDAILTFRRQQDF